MLYILYNVYIIFLFSFELKTGSNGGGEIERNDSGVGSETSGTAQRLKRMRRLKSSHQTDGSSSTPTSLPSDDIPVAAPWCVDCDQPVEPDQEEYVPLVIIFITKCVSKKNTIFFWFDFAVLLAKHLIGVIVRFVTDVLVDGASGAKCWPNCWRRKFATVVTCASFKTNYTSLY